MLAIIAFFILMLILLLIAALMQTAMILLPWTIPSIALGSIAGYLVGWKAPMSDPSRPAVGGFTTLAFVMGLAYAGLAIAQPKAPPFVSGEFNTTDRELAELTPIHLGISAAIGAAGVAMALGSSKKEKRLVSEVNEGPPV